MKNLIVILTGLLLICCSRVTTIPDRSTTTSGTLGTMKASDEPVRRSIDTTAAIDTAALQQRQ